MFGVSIPIFFFVDEQSHNTDKITDQILHKPKVMKIQWVLLLRSFAAGIMLGVAFIHLLFDGTEKLMLAYEAFPALSFTMATVGAILVLGIEQVSAAMLHSSISKPSTEQAEQHRHTGISHVGIVGRHSGFENRSAGQRACIGHDHQSEQFNDTAPTRGTRSAHDMIERVVDPDCNDHHIDGSSHHCEKEDGKQKEEEEEMNIVGSIQGHAHGILQPCNHFHAVRLVAESSTVYTIVKAYVMEMSVAVHSIIIGIALGSFAVGGPDTNIQRLRALIIAITLHQFFEGIGLGTILKAARAQLGSIKIIIFILTFAMTVSIGIFIGIMILRHNPNGSESHSGMLTSGILNSLAAGVMLYVALVEMMAEDFQTQSGRLLKCSMGFAMMLGTAVMAILAIWA
jgi:hypothetical protein